MSADVEFAGDDSEFESTTLNTLVSDEPVNTDPIPFVEFRVCRRRSIPMVPGPTPPVTLAEPPVIKLNIPVESVGVE